MLRPLQANRRGRSGKRGYNCFRVCDKEGDKIARCLCAGPSIWHDSEPRALEVTLPPIKGPKWLEHALGVHRYMRVRLFIGNGRIMSATPRSSRRWCGSSARQCQGSS